MNMNNYSTPIRYGVIGALIMSVFGILTYVFYRSLFSSFFIQMVFGLAYFASVVFIVVWGVISFKRESEGFSFFKAFVAGMIIFSMTMFASTFISYIIPNFIDTDYPQQLYELVKRSTAESMERFGAPDDEIEKGLDRIKFDQFQPTLAKTAQGFGISLGLGALLSLIIAAFASRRDPNLTDTQTTTQD